MFRTLLAFAFGAFLAQEFPTVLPNVKIETLKCYNQILKSEFYQKIKNDYNKNK